MCYCIHLEGNSISIYLENIAEKNETHFMFIQILRYVYGFQDHETKVKQRSSEYIYEFVYWTVSLSDTGGNDQSLLLATIIKWHIPQINFFDLNVYKYIFYE
jgi:hypothetical protein